MCNQRWYRRWLWWSRVGILVSILQIGAACYICITVRNNNDELRDGEHAIFLFKERQNTLCKGLLSKIIYKQNLQAVFGLNGVLCAGGGTGKRLQTLLIILPIASVMVVIVQWCTGSDVMAWRSLYTTCEDAWRAHYREMFDYCIREALCCLGRSRYYM